MAEETKVEVRQIAGDIVASYVSNNQIAAQDVPGFIQQVIAALSRQEAEREPDTSAVEPAVPVRRSVRKDAVVCLECGATQKTLKRHIRVAHGLRETDYRDKWGLAKDHPLVAPSYSQARATMAKKIGLGRKGRGGRS